VGLSLASTLALVAVGAVFDAPGAAAREAARPAIAIVSGRARRTVNGRGEAVDGLAQIAGPAIAGIGLGLFGALTSLWVAAAMLALAAAAGAYALPRDRRREQRYAPDVVARAVERIDHPAESRFPRARAGLRVNLPHSLLPEHRVIGKEPPHLVEDHALNRAVGDRDVAAVGLQLARDVTKVPLGAHLRHRRETLRLV